MQVARSNRVGDMHKLQYTRASMSYVQEPIIHKKCMLPGLIVTCGHG